MLSLTTTVYLSEELIVNYLLLHTHVIDLGNMGDMVSYFLSTILNNSDCNQSSTNHADTRISLNIHTFLLFVISSQFQDNPETTVYSVW